MMKTIGLNKQMLYLFLSNLSIYFIGMGISPILPLYAGEFGAGPSMVGLFMATTYISITAGVILTGWLSERVSPKSLLTTAGLLGVPALVLTGRATHLWQVMVLIGIIWFSGGMGLTTSNLLVGLVAGEKSRGKSFSLMSLAKPLAAVIGGIAVGQMVTWRGYDFTFIILSAVWAIIPVVALLKVKNHNSTKTEIKVGKELKGSAPLGRTFYFLLFASLLAAIAVNSGSLGVPMSMQILNFSANAVASTATVSGLVAIPFTLLIGALSDRLGRKGMLMLAFAFGGVGVLLLIAASHLWHFWLSATLILLANNASEAVGSAFAMDLLTSETLNRGLSRLQAVIRISGIMSSIGAGYVLDLFGSRALYITASALALIAVLQLTALTKNERTPQSLPQKQRVVMTKMLRGRIFHLRTAEASPQPCK